MEYTGSNYKCRTCAWEWDYDDDACPNCGEHKYILEFFEGNSREFKPRFVGFVSYLSQLA